MFINDNKHRLSFIRGAKDRIMTISSTGYFSAKATTTTTPRSLNPSPLLKTRPSRPMRCVVWIVEWMRYQPTDQRTQPVIEVLWPFDAPKQHKTLISVQWKEKSGKSQMPFTGAMVGGRGRRSRRSIVTYQFVMDRYHGWPGPDKQCQILRTQGRISFSPEKRGERRLTML